MRYQYGVWQATRKVFAVGFAVAVSATTGQAQSPVNLGPVVNSPARDAEPTFSADGSIMYFNCFGRNGRAGNDICVAHKADGAWSEPEVVEAVSTDEYTEVEPLLSPDGSRLYVMSDRPGGLGGPDIWVSDLVDGEWSEPVNLGAPINSPYADHCIYFSGPGWDVAFWTSTRPGGFGGNDIWTSERVDGVWTEPVNLGPNVNTSGNETRATMSGDGKRLHFGRDGDIYVSER